jgi:hypothetical protein
VSVAARSSEQFGSLIASEVARFSRIAASSGITAE